MSIIVKNITKYYDSQKALDNVSFEAHKGEILGFLGPNGAGKSTLMKILTCFIPPTSGEACVGGYNVMEQSLNARKNVGYLPENNPLYHDMYVTEFLLFVAELHGISHRRQRVKEMIRLTGLKPEQHKKIGVLSKGYRQRVGLAHALLHDPDVLILDEPTSGLDPNQLQEIRALIRKAGIEKTVMLSTHIMQEVEAICDRIIIINEGKIIADERSERFSARRGESQVIYIEFDKKISSRQLLTLPHIKTAEPYSDVSWRLSVATGRDIRSDLFNFAVSEGLAIRTLQEEKPTIEEMFRNLTSNRTADNAV